MSDGGEMRRGPVVVDKRGELYRHVGEQVLFCQK
jgi:hypothetical protein